MFIDLPCHRIEDWIIMAGGHCQRHIKYHKRSQAENKPRKKINHVRDEILGGNGVNDVLFLRLPGTNRGAILMVTWSDQRHVMMSAKRLENVTAGIARPFQTKKETNQQKIHHWRPTHVKRKKTEEISKSLSLFEMRKQQQQTNSNGERADVVRAALVNFFFLRLPPSRLDRSRL